MKTFGFEKLNVWQKSRTLSVFVYKLTSHFPTEEKFGLISQMRRCAISIASKASNISEGTGRHTHKDQARFTEIAYGSALELLNQSIISNDLGFLKNEDYTMIRTQITEITAMLDGLRKSQLKN